MALFREFEGDATTWGNGDVTMTPAPIPQAPLKGKHAIIALLDLARREKRLGPNEAQAKELARFFGVTTPTGVLVSCDANMSDSELINGLRPPFAVKLMSPDIVHKTDFGAVRLGVQPANLAMVCEEMLGLPQVRGLRVDGFLVEEIVTADYELVVGGKVDRRFGPIVMMGIGGVFLEMINDVVFRICPIDEADVHSMVAELRLGGILHGHRGSPPADMAAVVGAILAIAGPRGLLMELREFIDEVDVNPLLIGSSGAAAADVRILLTDHNIVQDGEVRP